MDPAILNLTQELLNARRKLLEVDGHVPAHEVDLDPHPQYQKDKVATLQFLVSPVAASIWAAMPAADTLLFGSALHQVHFDTSTFNQVMLEVNIGAAGFAGSTLTLMCGDLYSGVTTDFAAAGSTPNTIALVGGNRIETSGWFPLAGTAIGNKVFTIVGSGGDGIVSPSFGMITAYFKED